MADETKMVESKKKPEQIALTFLHHHFFGLN